MRMPHYSHVANLTSQVDLHIRPSSIIWTTNLYRLQAQVSMIGFLEAPANFSARSNLLQSQSQAGRRRPSSFRPCAGPHFEEHGCYHKSNRCFAGVFAKIYGKESAPRATRLARTLSRRGTSGNGSRRACRLPHHQLRIDDNLLRMGQSGRTNLL